MQVDIIIWTMTQSLEFFVYTSSQFELKTTKFELKQPKCNWSLDFQHFLSQVFTDTTLGSCLFFGSFCLQFFSSVSESCSIRLRSDDVVGYHRIFHFFVFNKSWVTLAACLGSWSIFTVKLHPVSFVAFGRMSAEGPTNFTIHCATSASSHTINKPVN